MNAEVGTLSWGLWRSTTQGSVAAVGAGLRSGKQGLTALGTRRQQSGVSWSGGLLRWQVQPCGAYLQHAATASMAAAGRLLTSMLCMLGLGIAACRAAGLKDVPYRCDMPMLEAAEFRLSALHTPELAPW